MSMRCHCISKKEPGRATLPSEKVLRRLYFPGPENICRREDNNSLAKTPNTYMCITYRLHFHNSVWCFLNKMCNFIDECLDFGLVYKTIYEFSGIFS